MDELKALYRTTSDHFRFVNPDVNHYRDGAKLPPPARLDISQYPGHSNVYVLRYDSDGNELTDTWHDDVQSAMEQCAFEFGVEAWDWEEV